jgi:type IV secretion system protein VirB10
MPTHTEPELTDRTPSPKGVLQKNLKMGVYVGAVLVLVLAMFISSTKKTTATTAAKPKDATTAPVVQDNTANNVQALRAQLDMEKQRQQQAQQDAALQSATVPFGTPAQQAAAASFGANGQATPPQAYAAGSVPPSQNGSGSVQAPQLTPEQQQAQQLAAKERERQYASRFESNLVYSRPEPQPSQQANGKEQPQNPYIASTQPGQPTNLTAARTAGELPQQANSSAGQQSYKRGAEVNVSAASGQPYVIFEGMTLDTVLMNRLDGDAAGPVKVLVSNPVYSHDHQHVLIPEGTIVLGEAKKIGGSGFGQQRRVSVVFHRMIMPDGFSADLDQFHGLDQIGQEGLKDKVNNHYLQIFGTSIALGVISGAAQITEGGNSINSTGSQAFVNGAAAGISQQATTVLDRFIQIPPTITIREGHRVKVYFTQDMLLPAYTNHTIPQTF